MNLLLFTDHTFLPYRAGGRESSIHDLATSFLEHGWSVRVLARRPEGPELPFPQPYETLTAADPFAALPKVVEQLGIEITVASVGGANYLRLLEVLPAGSCLYLRDVQCLETLVGRDLRPYLLLANSTFTAARARAILEIAVEAFPPLINLSNYHTTSNGEFVTFINPVAKKGVELAFAIAERLPEVPFLFCEGWPQAEADWQRLVDRCDTLANVTLVRRTTDMRSLYGRTRVLLVPSQWEEAWGRVVTEAQASGIPSLVSTVGGLADTAGVGGLALAADAPPDLWAATLQRLWQDEALRQSLSAMATAQAAHLRRYYAEATGRLAAVLESHWRTSRGFPGAAARKEPVGPEAALQALEHLAEQGRQAAAAGDWMEAERIWSPLLEHLSPTLLISWHNQLARALYESRQFERLLPHCERMRALFPANPEGFWRVAQVRMRQSNWSEAAHLWQEVLHRFADQAKPFWFEGLIQSLLESDQLGEAQQWAEAASQRCPDSPVGALGLARCHAAARRWSEAADAWERLFAAQGDPGPGSIAWHQARCEALMLAGRLEAAQGACARFSTEHPQHPQAWRAAARLAMLVGADRDAILSLEALEARHPQACTASDLEHLAGLQAELGRHGQAELVCDRGQERFPEAFKGIRSFRVQHQQACRPAAGRLRRQVAALRLLLPASPFTAPATFPAAAPADSPAAAPAAAAPPSARTAAQAPSLYSWPGYLRHNAFTQLLQAGVRQAGAHYIGIDMPSRALARGADLLLIQFPDVLSWREAPEALPLRMLEELEGLRAWRRQGTCLLWLVHNAQPHDLSPRLQRLWRGFHRRLGRLCDGFLAMGPSLRGPVEKAIPTLAGKPFASFLHPRYPITPLSEAQRRRCRAELGVGDTELLVGALGTISRYKGLPALVRMLRGLHRPDVRLLIAGQPRSAEILAELEQAIGDDPAILLRPGNVPDDSFAALTQACDRIVIPNTAYLTSGALVYALSAGRPVLARHTPFSADVRAALGPNAEALHLHGSSLDETSLLGFLEAPPAAAPPDLARFSDRAAGQAILNLHRAIRLGRNGGDQGGDQGGDHGGNQGCDQGGDR